MDTHKALYSSIIRIKYQLGECVTGFKDRKTSPNQQAKIESISSGTQTVAKLGLRLS